MGSSRPNAQIQSESRLSRQKQFSWKCSTTTKSCLLAHATNTSRWPKLPPSTMYPGSFPPKTPTPRAVSFAAWNRHHQTWQNQLPPRRPRWLIAKTNMQQSSLNLLCRATRAERKSRQKLCWRHAPPASWPKTYLSSKIRTLRRSPKAKVNLRWSS